MIKFCNGDLLKSDCEIICHQVNLQGFMGGGLALQIAQRYPECDKQYRDFVKNGFAELGTVIFWTNKMAKLPHFQLIANCFTQEQNFDTNYEAIRICFQTIKIIADIPERKTPITIGVPYKYGCGIANGEWDKVFAVFQSLFDNDDLFEFRIYKL